MNSNFPIAVRVRYSDSFMDAVSKSSKEDLSPHRGTVVGGCTTHHHDGMTYILVLWDRYDTALLIRPENITKVVM